MITQTTYHSYLLRLWRDSPEAPWRASLQATDTGDRINFAEIAKLFEFLSTTTSTAIIADPTNQPDDRR